MRDDVDYLPMAKPNALIYLEIRFNRGWLLQVSAQIGVVFTMEGDLRTPLRARRSVPGLVRPEKDFKSMKRGRLEDYPPSLGFVDEMGVSIE
jgi:hypothetical protein